MKQIVATELLEQGTPKTKRLLAPPSATRLELDHRVDVGSRHDWPELVGHLPRLPGERDRGRDDEDQNAHGLEQKRSQRGPFGDLMEYVNRLPCHERDETQKKCLRMHETRNQRDDEGERTVSSEQRVDHPYLKREREIPGEPSHAPPEVILVVQQDECDQQRNNERGIPSADCPAQARGARKEDEKQGQREYLAEGRARKSCLHRDAVQQLHPRRVEAPRIISQKIVGKEFRRGERGSPEQILPKVIVDD